MILGEDQVSLYLGEGGLFFGAHKIIIGDRGAFGAVFLAQLLQYQDFIEEKEAVGDALRITTGLGIYNPV